MKRSKALLLSLVGFISSIAAASTILVQSTTSTKNSGLYDFILPQIEADIGLTVHVVAVGTGQAIKNAERCDADVLLVHAKESEEKFVADGFGINRSDLMYNDFIIVGPASDPASISGMNSVTEALQKIAASQSFFASRGDNSGTHKAELRLWEAWNFDPTGASGSWYRETGSGMGATLNVGVGMNAYVMSDRATWIKFGNKRNFKIHVEGDPILYNQYGVMLVNPQKCPSANVEGGQQFIDWLLSAKGKKAIADYQIQGKQVFFPN